MLIYPMDLKHECEFISALSPLPQWDKCWRDFEKDGDRNDALYPIGNGVKHSGMKDLSSFRTGTNTKNVCYRGLKTNSGLEVKD